MMFGENQCSRIISSLLKVIEVRKRRLDEKNVLFMKYERDHNPRPLADFLRKDIKMYEGIQVFIASNTQFFEKDDSARTFVSLLGEMMRVIRFSSSSVTVELKHLSDKETAQLESAIIEEEHTFKRFQEIVNAARSKFGHDISKKSLAA